MAQEVERQHANAKPPPGSLRQNAFINLTTVVGNQAVEIVAQRLVKFAVVDDQVGFQIQRQAKRVEIAGADGGPSGRPPAPLYRVARAAAIFENLHAAFDQIVIEQASAEFDYRDIRLT